MDRRYLYTNLFLLSSVVLALPQATETGSSPAFPTMSAQDGFGVAEGGVGSADSVEAGNAGKDGSSWSLSTGGIVGICVAIAVVVIGAGKWCGYMYYHLSNIYVLAGMWWLWYMAKKRQWKIRESIKRASRRLTGRKNPPRTPRAAPSSNANRRGTMYAKPSAAPKTRERDIDLEKGVASKNQKPSPGWLAQEKERSRSRSPDSGEIKETPQAGGLMSKLGFGRR